MKINEGTGKSYKNTLFEMTKPKREVYSTYLTDS
jgi:hypothetical protein